MSTEQAYAKIRKRLTALRNKFLRLEFSVLALRVLAVFATVFAVAVLLTFASPSLQTLRSAVLTAIGVGVITAIWFGMETVRRWPTIQWIAAQAEKATPALKGDLLRGALSLWHRKENENLGYSVPLIEALVSDALDKSDAIQDREVLDRKRLKSHATILPVALALIAAFVFLMPGRVTRVANALVPPSAESILAELGLAVTPGDTRVEAGESVNIEALFDNYDGKNADLYYKNDGDWTKLPMQEVKRDAARGFKSTLDELSSETRYKVRFRDGESPVFKIAVTNRPMVTKIAYDIKYPEYTRIAPESVDENDGNIQALFGSEAALRVKANKSISKATLVLEEGEPIELARAGQHWETTFTVETPFAYTIALEDAEGAGNRNPMRYEVTPIADEKPFIRILFPAENLTASQDMQLPIQFAAIDDFGVRAVNLRYRVGEGEEKRVGFFSTDQAVREVERERNWDFSAENILPGDVISYYLEAYDNDPLNGPKRGVSRTYTIMMPSLAQMFTELDGEQEEEIDDLESVYQESERLEAKLTELAREIQRSQDVSWDEKKKIESVLDKQKEIEKQLRDVQQELQRSAEQMEENRLVTPETLERMEELHNLMEEVATQEMKDAMEKLADAMEKLDPEMIKEASKEMQMTQKDFMERLDRTIDMLKRMKDLQNLDALAEGMQRMAEEQRELREETNKASEQEMKEMSQQEKALQKELEKLQEAMDKLAKDSEENSPEFSEEIRKMQEKMEQSQPEKKMEQASQKMEEGNKPDATKEQKDAEDSLFDLAFQLVEFGQACQSASNSKAQAAFGESIQDLLHLSKGQETLSSRPAPRGRTSVEERRSWAERQQEVATGISRVMDKIRDVGKDVPELSSAILSSLMRVRDKASAAASQFEEGDLNVAQARGTEALHGINKNVMDLLRSQQNHASSCQNPSSSGQGQSQQMQQMTQQQRSLNEQMGQMPIPNNNPGSMSMEQQASLGRMAAEQQQIRKGMEQMSKGVEEGEGTSEILGGLDDIVEEMRKIERDLENAQISPETRERQERILSRMLDAQRSLRERGYKKSRRSKVARDFEATAPGSLPSSVEDVKERMREDLVRMPNYQYPPEYEELIRSYFRSLTEN